MNFIQAEFKSHHLRSFFIRSIVSRYAEGRRISSDQYFDWRLGVLSIVSVGIDIWIDDAVSSGLSLMARFARVLHRDIDAVRNAIELPWSNGQAEDQINRLKTIKRAMYGRAGTELLRARMLPVDQNRHHTK
jgi:hypothetical protein